jgi:hypothetical protein
MLVIYKERGLSYDIDWLEAFRKDGAEFTEYSTEVEFHDLNIILHSVTAQWGPMPEWLYKAKGKVLLLPGNEYKNLEEKNQFARDLGATIGTQLPLEAASFYDVPVIEVPHALNPDYFRPGKKSFDIGVRGFAYPQNLGDDDRNRICDPRLWDCLDADIKHGEFLPRGEWAKVLGSWRAMPSTEGGKPGAKCITSRHFDAIGSHTCLVMYPGFFNGILTEEHYIKLERDHSNIAEVRARILDAAHCDGVVSRAREYLADCHTHAHRVRQIVAWAEQESSRDQHGNKHIQRTSDCL